MPVFGEYATIGRPLFMNGRQGRLRTFWIAKLRAVEDGRVYVIKSVALPGPESPEERAAHGHPMAHRDIDDFQGVRRLLEAYRVQPELIAPTHAFGKTQTEFWYATDCYPRRSLAELESTSKHINDAGLEHLVHSIASACLALQRATGRSHGNLKPGNVLLAGEAGPLRRTPLRLIDAAGSVSLPTATENSEADGDAASCDATEARDLHGIGQIILQLVESRPVEGPEDYVLPIEASEPRRVLGKHSQRWLDACNRLLDPNLSLTEISLELLAKDFKPRPRLSWTTAILAAVGVILAAGIASYPMWSQHLRRVTETVLGDTQVAAAAQRPAPNRVGDSISDAAGTEPVRPSSRLDAKDAPERDKAPRLPSAMEMPSTSERIASTSVVTDTASEPVNPPLRTGNSGAAELAFGTGTTKPPPSGKPTAPDLETQAPDSGAPAGSETGRATNSSIQGLDSEPRVTESAAQTPGSQPKAVYAAKSPAPLPQPQGIRQAPRELGQTIISRPKPSRETKSERPEAVRSGERRGKALPQQSKRARAEPSQSRAFPRLETRTPGQLLMDTAVLDRELRQLEIAVGKVVAISRNSDLFARVNSLEAQYARANRISDRTKRRLDLLRINMLKKCPDPLEAGQAQRWSR